MPNLVAYNSGNTISNSIQFGTIVMDVNGDVTQGSLNWCPDFGICNQYIIVTDSYTNGKSNQLNARAMGFQTSGLTDIALINGINKLAASKFAGPFITLSSAINWAIYEGYFITNQEYPTIVTSGCVLNLDSNFPPSYPLVFNTWYDLTGNNNTGLLNNGISYNSALRGSLSLNGSDEYVSFSATTDIPIGNSNYTISVWFNPSTLSGDRGLIGWGNYGNTNEVNALKITSSGLVNYWWANDLQANYSFTVGDWYNTVATFDGTTRSLWINGSLINSDTPVGHNVSNSTNLTVGLTNSTEFFGGAMGEVQVFNRALDSNEISQNYSALLPRYNGTYTDPCDIAPLCSPTPTGTVAPTPSQTSTPAVTPTQTPPPRFLLNSTPNLPTGISACNDYNTFNRANYYASRANGGTIQSGTFLYTDASQIGNPSYYIPDGYYSNGTLYWFFQNGSTSDNGTPCSVPTSTPTATTTQTATPTKTPSFTSGPGGTPTPTSCAYTVWNLYYPCGTTTDADQLIPYDANLAPGIIVKLTNGLCYTIALPACYQEPGNFTVDGEYSTCEDCEQTYPTPTQTPTNTSTQTQTPSIGSSPTPTETQTQTPTGTQTQTPSIGSSPTPTETPTQTPSVTPTNTPTPTLLPPIFLLNPPQGGGGPDACESYNNLNRASYYSSISNGNTIQSGTVLYTDETQIGNPSYYIPDGYYSNGSLYWYFQGGSTSDNGTSCTVTTSTPTATVTQTQTPSFGSSPTPTKTPTSTPTATPTQTPSIGSSPTPTETPTQTPTSTQTGTPTQTPTITPMPTGTPFPTLPNYQRECTVAEPVCRAADPAFVTVYERNYDGYSNILNWLNIANTQDNGPYANGELYVQKIYDGLGRDITIYVGTGFTVELNLSYYGLVGGETYYVQYDVYCQSCGCTPVQVLNDAVGSFRLYNLGIGNATSSPVNYSTNISGQDACYNFNQSLYIYYDIAQTNISLGAPLLVGSTIYLNSARTTTAPAGAYVMRNNNKYIVNSSGVVTSIETNVCTSPPTFSLKFKKDTFTWKAGFSVCNFRVGDSYIIYNVNCSTSQLRGTIQSKTGTGANQILTLTNWTTYCG